jgi:hypothetical protein
MFCAGRVGMAITRRVMIRLGLACLLVGSGLTAASLSFPISASASCSSDHENVEASDYEFFGAYGNKGYIYLNKEATLSNLNDTVGRTFAVVSDNGEQDVEFGWLDNDTIGGTDYTTPTPVSDYMIGGITQNPTPLTGYTLSYDTDTWFRIDNVGGNEIFRYVIDGQSSPIGYSPTMNFNVGWPLTNSERYNTCDSLYTHQYDLSEDVSGGSDPVWQDYSTLECFANTSSDWYMHINSDTNLDVTQTASGGYGYGSGGYNCQYES